ncbi:MAG: response regulator transcription factor [Christensenellales bacterium]
MNYKVYVLEDDESIRELVTMALEMAQISIKSFSKISDFLEAIDKELPIVILLDIMLPDGNGLDVLTKVKAKYPHIQCIMLSALSQELDKVKGLNSGADDYITKPFSTLELIARVKAALRRCVNEEKILDDLIINKDKMEVTYKGKVLELNNKEYQLLLYFVENPDVVLSRERLINAIWGYDYLGESRTIDNHILRLRKLGFLKLKLFLVLDINLEQSRLI